MSLVRYYNPFRELDHMRKTTNQLFNGSSFVKPAVDIIEDEDNYIFEMALPGFTKDEITIEAAADELVIEAKRAETEETTADEEGSEEETPKVRYLRRERRDVAYRRSFSFNKPINPQEAQVKLENGILTITLAKAPEAKPRKLAIEAQ